MFFNKNKKLTFGTSPTIGYKSGVYISASLNNLSCVKHSSEGKRCKSFFKTPSNHLFFVNFKNYFIKTFYLQNLSQLEEGKIKFCIVS